MGDGHWWFDRFSSPLLHQYDAHVQVFVTWLGLLRHAACHLSLRKDAAFLTQKYPDWLQWRLQKRGDFKVRCYPITICFLDRQTECKVAFDTCFWYSFFMLFCKVANILLFISVLSLKSKAILNYWQLNFVMTCMQPQLSDLYRPEMYCNLFCHPNQILDLPLWIKGILLGQ